MGRIVISTNVSLDGVVQDPDGEEGSALGGWFGAAVGADQEAWAAMFFEEALHTEALLLGRRTDAWFAERWLGRSGEWAERLNGLPKYVVSSTIDAPRWTNATIIGGDAVAGAARVKSRVDGDLVVYASYQLARTLLENGLVDELRLVVIPVVVGGGDRLFGETSAMTSLRLLDSRTLGQGLAHLIYEVV